MQLTIDPELRASNEAYKQTNTKLKKQWTYPSNGNGYTQALTGTGLNSLNPKSGTQWLSFAGSQRERSEGVIDSFTGKRDGVHCIIVSLRFALKAHSL